MELKKYVTKNEHRENDQEPPQTCMAAQHSAMALTPFTYADYHGVELKPGEWVAVYTEDGGFACVYTDAEFNELYELVT